MQMGVEVSTVTTPLSAVQRSSLRAIDKITLPPGGVQGTGVVYTLSRNTNASFKVLNAALAAGAQASLTRNEIVLAGSGIPDLARENSLTLHASGSAPADAVATKKPRVGLYRSWNAAIDEGWTRWILQDFGFAPITLRNADIQVGHLRDRLDTIILPDQQPGVILDGFSTGVTPGEFAGGVGAAGVEALREFVRDGGTLIAFNNASLFVIDQLHLPVANVLKGVPPEQFYSSGSLLRIEVREPTHIAVAGLPREPIVMFESGPAFDTSQGFRGVILAGYSREDNPLASGYLLHPERIQGKAAALEVFYGDGRVYLFGFRPQWRGQSHGAYKFVFNAVYDSPASSKPTTPPRERPASTAPADPLVAVTARVRADLTALLAQNRAFFAARGQAAVDERVKLNTVVDAFEKERIQEVQDAAATLDADGKRKASDLVRAMRRAAADLRAKEIESSVDADALAEKYGITP
jgi:hypothetical protein